MKNAKIMHMFRREKTILSAINMNVKAFKVYEKNVSYHRAMMNLFSTYIIDWTKDKKTNTIIENAMTTLFYWITLEILLKNWLFKNNSNKKISSKYKNSIFCEKCGKEFENIVNYEIKYLEILKSFLEEEEIYIRRSLIKNTNYDYFDFLVKKEMDNKSIVENNIEYFKIKNDFKNLEIYQNKLIYIKKFEKFTKNYKYIKEFDDIFLNIKKIRVSIVHGDGKNLVFGENIDEFKTLMNLINILIRNLLLPN